MATIIALMFSVLLIVKWGFFLEPLPTDVLSYVEGFYGLGFLLALVVAVSWNRLKLTPVTALLFAYPVFTFGLALFQASRVMPNALFLVPVWLIVTGLATDALFLLLKPESWSDIKKQIVSSKGVLGYQEAIDVLAQETAQAMDCSSIARVNQGLNLFSTVYDRLGEGEGKEVKILYPQEMLEMLNRNAIDHDQTVLSQKIFTTLGTLGLECLKICPDLAPFALVKIEQGTLLAMKRHLHELTIKGIITLQQTALMSPEIKGWGLFVAQAVRSLDILAKESFRRDKSQSINQLLVPILDLDNRLKSYDKAAEYPLAKMEISRVIEEFQALDAVLKQMPRIEEAAQKS